MNAPLQWRGRRQQRAPDKLREPLEDRKSA
jgi:hypothetical protein